jgi:hypothetical protein
MADTNKQESEAAPKLATRFDQWALRGMCALAFAKGDVHRAALFKLAREPWPEGAAEMAAEVTGAGSPLAAALRSLLPGWHAPHPDLARPVRGALARMDAINTHAAAIETAAHSARGRWLRWSELVMLAEAELTKPARFVLSCGWRAELRRAARASITPSETEQAAARDMLSQPDAEPLLDALGELFTDATPTDAGRVAAFIQRFAPVDHGSVVAETKVRRRCGALAAQFAQIAPEAVYAAFSDHDSTKPPPFARRFIQADNEDVQIIRGEDFLNPSRFFCDVTALLRRALVAGVVMAFEDVGRGEWRWIDPRRAPGADAANPPEGARFHLGRDLPVVDEKEAQSNSGASQKQAAAARKEGINQALEFLRAIERELSEPFDGVQKDQYYLEMKNIYRAGRMKFVPDWFEKAWSHFLSEHNMG